MNKLVNVFTSEESGQGLVEYAFILMLIALAAVAVIRDLGKGLIPIFTEVGKHIK